MSNLRVFYGWAKLNKVFKREAISVIFENGTCWRNDKAVSRWLNVVYTRKQTDEEAKDAIGKRRMFTSYNLFLDDKKIKGNVEYALQLNYQADANNVSVSERKKIYKLLKEAYKDTHKNYHREPIQLDLFEDYTPKD